MMMIETNLKHFKETATSLSNAFDRDIARDSRNKISEPDIRIQFLDPFFTALGWDVGNRALSPFHGREVVVEPPHRMQGHNRRPDYLFRVGGIDKFICEAKRPGEDLARHHFQIQNYVFNLKLWIGVLSDFNSFQVFLVGSQPTKDSPFSALRGWSLNYQNYSAEAEKIWNTFARDNVYDGSLERLAQSVEKVYRPGKQGWLVKPERNERIDERFLGFLEDQRSRLAKGLHRKNRALDGNELTEGTQKIINRLLFQRICEDRDIDVGRTLEKALQDWHSRGRVRGQLWTAIVSNFRHMSRTFNGGLFGKPQDKPHFIDSLDISEEWVSDFLDELAGDDSKYLLSVIPVEILGSVYERFLGSVVTKIGEVEPKPEVRKSKGVYYTPKAIVDEIVGLTVGVAVAGKSPSQLRRFRVLDPACGSGSFLLGSFERLCRHHLEWLMNNPNEQKPVNSYKNSVGDLSLTTGYKRTVLTNSIFGVDLDPQAVEVTQMSLYLKVLEGETTESLNADHRLFPKETYLPSLDDNIKVGDSIIDFQASLELEKPVTAETQQTAFDWKAEFPTILKQGGFDAVIGNPPYFSVEKTWGKGDPRLGYLRSAYSQVYQDRSDILFYFLAKAIALANGPTCFIVSRAFLEAHKAQKLRKWLAEAASPTLIIDFGNRHIFEGVGITTAIVKIDKKDETEEVTIYRAKSETDDGQPVSVQLTDVQMFDRIAVPASQLGSAAWLFGTDTDKPLMAKIDQNKMQAGQVLTIGQGMQTGLNSVFGGLPTSVVKEWRIPAEAWFIRARNSDIRRWNIRNSGEVLLYPNAYKRFADMPEKMRDHLQKHRDRLRHRAAFKRKDCEWWQYTWPLHADKYVGPRIICPYLATENRFALDENRKFLGLTDTTVIFSRGSRENLCYFLGLLNSKVLTWRFRFIGKLKSAGIREYFHNSIALIPIHRIDYGSARQRELHDTIVKQVTRSIASTANGLKAVKPSRTILASITASDEKIDRAVCELYGLTAADFQQICKDLDQGTEAVTTLGDAEE